MGFIGFPVGAVGSTPQLGGPGLALVTSATFSAVASLSFNSCFTRLADDYLVTGYITASTTANISMRVRANGVDLSTASYYWTQTSGIGTNASSIKIMDSLTNADPASFTMTVHSPMLARNTQTEGQGNPAAGYGAFFVTGGVRDALVYDGMSVITSSGTISGTVRVYALRNA